MFFQNFKCSLLQKITFLLTFLLVIPVSAEAQSWESVRWKSNVNTIADYSAGASGSTLARTKFGRNSWVADAVSAQIVKADGAISWKFGTKQSPIIVGLLSQNKSQSINDAEFAVYSPGNGRIAVYHSGKAVKSGGEFSINDTFEIERKSTKIFFKRNGSTFYTSKLTSSNPLMMDAAFHADNTKIFNARIRSSSPSEQPGICRVAKVADSRLDGFLLRDDLPIESNPDHQGTRQWIEDSCLARIKAKGIPIEIIEYSQIQAQFPHFHTAKGTMGWVPSCDEMIKLLGKTSTPVTTTTTTSTTSSTTTTTRPRVTTTTVTSTTTTTRPNDGFVPDPKGACIDIMKNTEAGVLAKINEYKNRPVHCPARVRLGTAGIKPESFGAVGNGSSNDTSAIQKAISAAESQGKYVVLTSGKTYLISNTLSFRNGIRGMISSGSGKATIKTASSFPGSAFVLRLYSIGQPSQLSNFVVQNINVDFRLGGKTGMFAQPVKKVSVYDSVFSSNGRAGTGALYVINYSNSRLNTQDVCIEGNSFHVADGGDASKSPGEGIYFRGYQADRYAATLSWSETKSVSKQGFDNRRVRIANNTMNGGRYGISLINYDSVNIINNTVRNNMRNIKWARAATNFLVDSNKVYNSKSTSFLFNYDTHGHVVTRNRLETSRASAWGMIEMSIGTDNNIIAMNEFISPTKSPSHHYGIYTGPHTNNNRFFKNKFTGYFSKAFFAVEGSQSKHSNSMHRTGVAPYVWQNAHSINNQIVGNHFNRKRLDRPAFFLSQTSVGLRNTTMRCNSFTNNTSNLINRLETSPGGTTDGDQSKPWN